MFFFLPVKFWPLLECTLLTTPVKIWAKFGVCDSRHIDKAWRGENQEVSRVVLARLGSILAHPDIQVECPELHRSDAGLHIFLRDLHKGLKLSVFWEGTWTNPYAMAGSAEGMSF